MALPFSYTPSKRAFTRVLPSGNVGAFPINTETDLILQKAEELGITTELVDGTDVVKLAYGDLVQFFRNQNPPTNAVTGLKICINKEATKSFLKKARINIIKGFTIYKGDGLELIDSVWNSLQKPLVVKPTHGSNGQNVKIGLSDEHQFKQYLQEQLPLLHPEEGIVVEEKFDGEEFRITANKDQVLAISKRIRAHVDGDGIHTIKELIEEKNKLPIRNVAQDLYPHIEINQDLIDMLAEQHLNPDSILPEKQRAWLRKAVNMLIGGEVEDYTDKVHPSIKQIGVDIVRSIPGLSWAGIDFLTQDITQDQKNISHAVIEVNSAPEFAMHDLPMDGQPRDIAFHFLKMLFPNL